MILARKIQRRFHKSMCQLKERSEMEKYVSEETYLDKIIQPSI